VDSHTQGDKAQQLLLIYINTITNIAHSVFTRNIEESLTKCDTLNPPKKRDPLLIQSVNLFRYYAQAALLLVTVQGWKITVMILYVKTQIISITYVAKIYATYNDT